MNAHCQKVGRVVGELASVLQARVKRKIYKPSCLQAKFSIPSLARAQTVKRKRSYKSCMLLTCGLAAHRDVHAKLLEGRTTTVRPHWTGRQQVTTFRRWVFLYHSSCFAFFLCYSFLHFSPCVPRPSHRSLIRSRIIPQPKPRLAKAAGARNCLRQFYFFDSFKILAPVTIFPVNNLVCRSFESRVEGSVIDDAKNKLMMMLILKMGYFFGVEWGCDEDKLIIAQT